MKTCGNTDAQPCWFGGDCKCFRPEGHSLNYEHPHGCMCGNLW